jgi:putative transposase
MKYVFIYDHRKQWSVTALCRILDVSRSGYFTWCQRNIHPSASAVAKRQQEAQLLLHIQAAHRRGRFYYGSPRVYDELRERGIRTSRKRVARLMKQNGLVGRSRARRRISTTDSNHAHPVAANLLDRRFTPQEVARPNRFWCGDITYLPTQEGWLYLATVTDLFSRRILGWALGETLEATLVAAAWKRALKTRGFHSGQGPELYHSDRGSQYAGYLFRDLLETAGTKASMSRTGQCLDNAVAESFFGTLKAELLNDQPGRCFASKALAKWLVEDYIDHFYNTVRRHSALGNQSPLAFELAHQFKKQRLLSNCPL